MRYITVFLIFRDKLSLIVEATEEAQRAEPTAAHPE